MNNLQIPPVRLLVSSEPTEAISFRGFLKEKVHQVGLGTLAFFREVGALFIAAGETIAFWIDKATAWIGKKLGFPQKDIQKTQDTSLPIILLVHGYLHNESGWRSFRNALTKEEQSLGEIHVITKEKNFTSIDLYSEQIHKKLEEIQARSIIRRKVILVGHSMGGLATINYVNKHALPQEVAGIITLGTPLHGSSLAKKIGVGACAREMEPHSKFLTEMLKNTDKHTSVRFYHFAFSHDGLVPPQNALRKGSLNAVNELAEGFGHAAPLYNRGIQQRMIHWIKDCLKESS